MKKLPPSPLELANGSGFPLQIAVAKTVEDTEVQHGWTVLFSEHYWKSSDGGHEGWIDLVLRDRSKSAFLVIECKRPADAVWSAFNDDGTNEPRRLTSVLVSKQPAGQHDVLAKMYHTPAWADVAVEPPSPEASYCVIKGDGQGKFAPTLEHMSREVLSSTEALSRQLVNYRPANEKHRALYFSAIVTTADLQFLTFPPGKVSLEKGTIPEAESVATPASHFRFRKQMSRRLVYPAAREYENVSVEGLSETMRHSLFVIRAAALVDFLYGFNIDDTSYRNERAG